MKKSLERFRLPRTPESRTPLVLLLLGALGLATAAIRGGWRFLAGSSYGVELLLGAAFAAILYATVRYIRQP